jgi:ribose transport system substrate-binding protein
MRRSGTGIRYVAALLLMAASAGALAPRLARADSLQLAQARVALALAPDTIWDGPLTGPKARVNKTIVFIAADLGNTGIARVLAGVREAATAIGWSLKVVDAAGSEAMRIKALKEAAADGASGVILGGFDAINYAPWIDNVAAKQMAVVGWHATFEPGMVPGTQLFTNVATSAREVALAAASYGILQSGGKGGFIIFTDSNFSVAQAKADDMAVIVRNCANCELLATIDIPLASVEKQMPGELQQLKKQFGARWLYALGINDLYFDAMAESGDMPAGLATISAGDGSPSAFGRIRTGTGQMATIAEPLNLQGWQLIDELNRAFAGEEPSGYVPNAHLIVQADINEAGGAGDSYDPHNGYRDAYRKIWKP